jgi:squalene-hopene/tetraprenyl-beta-curcumene cyclase
MAAMGTEALVAHLARLAIGHIEWERWRGFPDAHHRMVFHHRKGFTGATELQIGDVFARAIIADALCDARDGGGEDLSATLESECIHLVDRRRRSGCGGWSYFPALPELPPDIDDLAEVMQVLTRCGREGELQAYVEPPLSTVLSDGLRPNGAFGTWIIPRENRSDLEARQAHRVEILWGDTDDVEVVANFLFALTLYDRERFNEVLSRGLRYVEDQQGADGCWQSTWYVGPYYGTYVCTRALAVSGRQAALSRARSFLLDTQRRDGGWGGGRICSQLDTALALCAICVVAERLGVTAPDRERIHNGLQALTGALVVCRGWDASLFGRINVGRARGEAGPELRYGSSAVTAAYVLKAAMAARQAMAVVSAR